MKRTSLIVLLVVLAVLAFIGWQWRNSPLFEHAGSTTGGQLVSQAHYQCDQGKTIDAQYYQGQTKPAQAGQPPVPGGYVMLTLSDGRSMTLNQTISADGARYSDGNPQLSQGQAGAEKFVFWSKGNGALVLENNEAKSYIGCVMVANDPGGLSQVYSDKAGAFSIRYPQGYTVDPKYVYQIGEQAIGGVKFTIDPSIATGTNLSSDSYVSVEQIASSSQCTAGMFLGLMSGQSPTTLSDGVHTYSYASSTDAAAGNRYEEQVFAIPDSNPCTAVRYMIHWGVYQNYPPGAVKEFNHDQLQNQFDKIRSTLVTN
jgi:membrane-bound inhibitor of C-type lysozyme